MSDNEMQFFEEQFSVNLTGNRIDDVEIIVMKILEIRGCDIVEEDSSEMDSDYEQYTVEESPEKEYEQDFTSMSASTIELDLSQPSAVELDLSNPSASELNISQPSASTIELDISQQDLNISQQSASTIELDISHAESSQVPSVTDCGDQIVNKIMEETLKDAVRECAIGRISRRTFEEVQIS